MTMKKYLDLFEAAPMPTGSTALPATTPAVTVNPVTKPVKPGDASAYVGGPVDATAQMSDTSKAIPNTQSKVVNNLMQDFEESMEETVEEELAEMMRLSGLALTEKAVSKQQQKFMGMVHAMQKGEEVKGASPELKKVAKDMSKKDAKDFASTKHKGLPKKVTEDVMLDEGGSTLNHIANRFKYEVKMFMQAGVMDNDLYEALSDYYIDRGEVPYGVAKGKPGFPEMTQWVEERFYADMGSGMSETIQQPVMDDTLNELAHLAGLSESKLDECGDMGMDQRDTINVSTNMSSDGNKSVNITAQGEKAEELLSMLKLAGMGGSDRPSVMVVDRDEEMMDEERETEYANTPEEEYETVAAITRQGNDLNREKRQYADKPKLGDNPMAEGALDADLDAMLESILIRENQDEAEIKKDPETGRVRMTMPPPKRSDMPNQSEFPLPSERESRVSGPRSLKVGGEPTGTEKEVDESWEDIKTGVSNAVGDFFNTEPSIRRRSQQYRDLEAMQQQFKPGTPQYDQLEKRKSIQRDRYYGDKGEVVDKAGEPIKVLPPDQWKGN